MTKQRRKNRKGPTWMGERISYTFNPWTGKEDNRDPLERLYNRQGIRLIPVSEWTEEMKEEINYDK